MSIKVYKHKYKDLTCKYCHKEGNYQLDNKKASSWLQVFICQNKKCGAMFTKTINKVKK